MSFLYPLGLLALLGIPILIAIYIIKNKYTEQVIASTYIWTLSEKFLKKRLPIHRIVGLISLLLQIAAVLFVSFAVAHPVIVLPNAAADYCFILDGSGSMNIASGDKTRFDAAKDEIASVISGSVEGSSYSLVLAGSTADKIFDGVTDKQTALKLLDGISASYAVSTLTDALGVAQGYFNDNTSANIYLLTDKTLETSENVTVINVSSQEKNHALFGMNLNFDGEKIKVDLSVISYGEDATLTVGLYLNGQEEAVEYRTVETVNGETVPVEFETAVDGYTSVRAAITESDSMPLDNEIIIYNTDKEDQYTALLVSDAPFFLHTALLSVGKADVTHMKVDDFIKLTITSDAVKLGYDLYVFDGYSPEVMPKDGAVWFVNPKTAVPDSGFAVQDEIVFAEAQNPKYSADEELLENIGAVESEDIYITKYKKCGTYRKFTTLLTIEGNPLIFAGTNSYGNREVVFAFDLHDSNFPLLPDYIILADNLLNYTFPLIVDEVSYVCGDIMQVNVVADCESIKVISPMGKTSYLDTSNAVCEYELTEVGIHSVLLTVGGKERTLNVYCSLPQEESAPSPNEHSFVIAGVAGNERRDGIYSSILYLFILLAVVCAADWVVYCYEQYQLR